MKCKGLFGSFLIVRTFTYIGWASSRGPGLGLLWLNLTKLSSSCPRRMSQPVECPIQCQPNQGQRPPTAPCTYTWIVLLIMYIVLIQWGGSGYPRLQSFPSVCWKQFRSKVSLLILIVLGRQTQFLGCGLSL